MLRRTMGLSALLGALLLASGGAVAADAAQEPIFGSQLMTEQERTVHRARMWAAENDEARNAIRAEHHEQMRARAQERGVSLPEVPPARGAGMGQGRGMGQGPALGPGRGAGPGAGPGAGQGAGPGRGMGPGQGMGPGRGMGPGQGAGQGPGQGMGQGMGQERTQ